MCKIGITDVPFFKSTNLNVQSKLQINTYLAQTQKFTTGDPINVSHRRSDIFDVPDTFEIGPDAVLLKLFRTC